MHPSTEGDNNVTYHISTWLLYALQNLELRNLHNIPYVVLFLCYNVLLSTIVLKKLTFTIDTFLTSYCSYSHVHLRKWFVSFTMTPGNVMI